LKRSTFFLFAILTVICFIKCNHGPSVESNNSNPDSVKKIIIALNEEIYRSMDNPEKYQTFFEDSMLYVADGEIVTSIKKLSHDLWARYILPHDYTFRLFGNTAVLSYLSTSYELVNKDTIFHSLRSLRTFALNNGKWKVTCSGLSNVPVNYFKPIVDKHEKDYASYVGNYQINSREVDTVFTKDGKLFDKSGGDAVLNFPVNDNEYMINGDLGRLSFGKDCKGVVSYYTITNQDGQSWKCPKIK
jgi:hypothetical protein